MVRRPDRGCEDLGLETVIVVDPPDVGDQPHAVDIDVVEPADERRDVGGTGLGGEQRLHRREAQRDIGLETLVRQFLACLEAGKRQRQLDADILGDAGKELALADHFVGLDRSDLGGYRTVDDLADLGDDILHRPVGLHDQRRIGGHSVDQTRLGQVLDLGKIGSIDKEFHGALIRLGDHSRDA